MSEDKTKVTTAKFDFGKTADDAVHLTVDGHKYTLGEGNAFKRVVGTGAAATTEILEGDKLANALTKAFTEAEKSKYPPHLFDKLQALAVHFDEVPHIQGNAAALESMEFAVKTALLRTSIQQATATGASAEQIAEARKMIMTMLADGNFDKKHVPSIEFTEFTKSLGKDGWSKMQKTIEGAKALAKEVTNTTFAEDAEEAGKQLQRILAKHHSKDRSIAELKGILPESVSEHLQTQGFGSFDAVVEEFSGQVSSAKASLEEFASKRAGLERDVRMAKKSFFGGNSLKEAEEALVEHDKQVAEFLKEHPANGAAFKETSEGIQATLRSSSTISSAANDAVKGVGSAVEGKGSWFTHSADELEKIAKGKGTTVEKLGFLSKRTTGGKWALFGIPAAIVATYFVTAGNRGPADRSESVGNRSREQGHSTGVA